MRPWGLAASLLLVSGCSLVQQPPEPVWAIVIVNESDRRLVLVFEESGAGERLPVGPCSSASRGLGPGFDWRIEFDGPVVREADMTFVPDAPVTVVEVLVSSRGAVALPPLRGAPSIPDAPLPDRCADPSSSLPRSSAEPPAGTLQLP